MKESELKRDILTLLILCFPKGKFWNQRTTGVHKPNGHWIPSSLPGVSDILGCVPSQNGTGVMVAIEVKLPSNKKPTFAQEDFIMSITNAGGIAFVGTDPEDVVKELTRRLNAISKERLAAIPDSLF